MTQAEPFPLSPNHLNSARELSTGWLPRRGTNGGISQRRKQLAGAVSSEPRFFLKAPPPAGRGSHTRCALVGPPLPQTHVTSTLKTASLPGHTARGAVVYRARSLTILPLSGCVRSYLAIGVQTPDRGRAAGRRGYPAGVCANDAAFFQGGIS